MSCKINENWDQEKSSWAAHWQCGGGWVGRYMVCTCCMESQVHPVHRPPPVSRHSAFSWVTSAVWYNQAHKYRVESCYQWLFWLKNKENKIDIMVMDQLWIMWFCRSGYRGDSSASGSEKLNWVAVPRLPVTVCLSVVIIIVKIW